MREKRLTSDEVKRHCGFVPNSMKTNINELNIEDMEMINGGYGIKDFVGDTFAIIIGGPVGEVLVATKHILEATK